MLRHARQHNQELKNGVLDTAHNQLSSNVSQQKSQFQYRSSTIGLCTQTEVNVVATAHLFVDRAKTAKCKIMSGSASKVMWIMLL